MDDRQSRTDTRGDDVENRRRYFGGSIGAFVNGLMDDRDWDVELPEEEEDPPIELPVPTGLELTEADNTYRACPFAHLEELRTREPVHRDAVLNRLVLTRHGDVTAVLDNKDLSSDPAKANAGTFARRLANDPTREPMLPYLDDAAHARLRGLVSQVFSPATFEAFRPRIRAITETILEDLEENEFEFDVVAKYTARVPMLVAGDLLGIEATQLPEFKLRAAQVVGGFFNPSPTDDERLASATARNELMAELRGLIGVRHVTPADDLISALLRAELDGDRLSDAEIVDQCLVLLAGTTAIEALLANGLKALLQNTLQMSLILEQRDLLEGAVEEMLRFDPPVLSVVRIARDDTITAGCPVATGETVWASLAAANRDPAVYAEPDDFDVRRSTALHVAFGAGAHACLGAQLARIEAQEAILGLIARFEEIETSPQGWEFAPLTNLRSLKNFWIRT
jgi:cytochrome P450